MPSLSSSNGAHSEPPNAPTPSSLEADIARLTSLLSQDADTNIDDSDPANVAELLRRLEAAESLADGVETRLDGVMGNLDSLLNDLVASQSAGDVKTCSEVAAAATDAVEKPEIVASNGGLQGSAKE